MIKGVERTETKSKTKARKSTTDKGVAGRNILISYLCKSHETGQMDFPPPHTQ